MDLDPGKVNLPEMGAVDRQQIRLSDITKITPQHRRRSKLAWHSFWLLTLVGLAGGGVYGKRACRVRCRPPNPGDPEIELREIRTEATPTAPLRQDRPFQFTAKPHATG